MPFMISPSSTTSTSVTPSSFLSPRDKAIAPPSHANSLGQKTRHYGDLCSLESNLHDESSMRLGYFTQSLLSSHQQSSPLTPTTSSQSNSTPSSSPHTSTTSVGSSSLGSSLCEDLSSLLLLAPGSPDGKFEDNSEDDEFRCRRHGEKLRCYCETCSRRVCQECSLWEHRDHICRPVSSTIVSERARSHLIESIDVGRLGTKMIKGRIDDAVAVAKSTERQAAETCARIRRFFKQLVQSTEERERELLERVERLKKRRMDDLAAQMEWLRGALAGVAMAVDDMTKAAEQNQQRDVLDIMLVHSRGREAIDEHMATYHKIEPKEETLVFVAPNFEVLQDIRHLGDVFSAPASVSPHGSLTGKSTLRAPPRYLVGMPPTFSNPSSSLPSPGTYIVKGSGQCIPGLNSPVIAKIPHNPQVPRHSFALDGHEDGKVSRPWGLCVDIEGNIIVADRRNNRVQIFTADGTFKLKFGKKGTGPGEFDLPAGITTDPQNRIVVVDKDNHRVQLFTSGGDFVLKFGTYGKESGQFQYPWDVAVNAKGDILVTDSRNHRIQLFTSEGIFVTRFNFDGSNHNRLLKGLTTPRGVCFNPQGDIIVSDFENHRLLLIDSQLTKISASHGCEGAGVMDFSRPSGIICDDKGKIIVADSKNQRVLVFSPQLEFLWMIDIRGVGHDEKDRPSDVALTPYGQLVVMIETLPDSRDMCNVNKTFIQIF